MHIEDSLEKLGLTQNEITIYVYLLKVGLKPGKSIYEGNNLDKSSAYEALHNLESKGLIYALGAKRNQEFGAHEPSKIYDLLYNKQRELDTVKNDISDFIKDIDAYVGQRYKSKNITVLEGKDSYSQWTNAKHSAKKGSSIREFLSYLQKSEFLDNFSSYAVQTPKDRVKKGINMKSLTSLGDWEAMYKEFPEVYISSKKLMKEFRVLPEEPKIDIPANFATFDNKTSLLRFKNEQFFGVIIEDKLITNLMNNMFDFMWHFSLQK